MLWIDPAKVRSWFQSVMARIGIETQNLGEGIESVRNYFEAFELILSLFKDDKFQDLLPTQ